MCDKDIVPGTTPERLAEDHWEFIKSVLANHGVVDGDIDMIEFHYITAFVHGYKHGKNLVEKE